MWNRCVQQVAASLIVGATLIAPALAKDEATAPDPVEGKWLGTAGSPRERIEVGLEFRRTADGQLELLLTQPISNYFAAEPGGAVKRDGARVEHEGLALALTLEGDTLRGTYPGPRSPAEFRRVSRLPQEKVPPKLPIGPEPRWQTRLGGQVFATPVVADGIAYVGTTGGIVNAIDTRSGAFVWTHTVGHAVFGAAAVDGDAVYVASDGGALLRLDRADGKLRWRYALDDADVERVLPHPQVYDWDWQGAQPVVADGAVFIGAADGGFHAVDAQTGMRRWRFDTRGKIRSAAAVDGERIVVGSADHFVYSLERATGRERWRFDTRAEVDATPVLHDGRVLVGNRGAGLFSLDAAGGEEKWRLYFWGSWVESTPVVVDGTIYIGSSDLRRVSAIDPADGRVLWRSDVFGWTWGTPLVIGDRLHVAAAGGAPYFVRHLASYSTLDRATGKLLTRRPLPDTGGHQWGIAGSPVLAGDTVLVATIEGSLYGFPAR